MQRRYNERSKKKKKKSEVVIPNHKLNTKALSPCHAALLCNNLVSILVLDWKSCISQSAHWSPGLQMLNSKHSYDFSSGPFFTGYCWVLLFEPFAPQKYRSVVQRGPWSASAPGRAPLRFLANLGSGQELTPAARLALEYLLLNLEVLEKGGGNKLAVPCCARNLLFCF